MTLRSVLVIGDSPHAARLREELDHDPHSRIQLEDAPLPDLVVLAGAEEQDLAVALSLIESDRPLVIVAGEFGRTPKVNTKTPAPGRDHWARNFGLLMAGAGIKGGTVLGKTSANGQEVIDRAVSVEDVFQTICRAMKIDANKELFTPGGRPLKIVDGGKAIGEILV